MQTPSRFKTTTLKELGPQLPIGIPVAGKLVKDLDVVPYKLPQERELAKARKEGVTGLRYAEKVLAILLKRYGPHDFTTLSRPERELIINQSFVGDVLYAFCWVRCAAIGTDLTVRITCPRCTTNDKPTETPITGSFDTLDVEIVTDPAELSYDVELRNGLVVNGQLRTKLGMQPPIWGRLSDGAVTPDEFDQVLALTRACLHRIDGSDAPPVFLDSDADDLSKYDIEVLKRDISVNSPGPVMLIEAKCMKCMQPLVHRIEWMSPDFFSLSSTPGAT